MDDTAETATWTYVGGFLALPALVLAVWLLLFSFNIWIVLLAMTVFGVGVVLGPAMLGGTPS